MNTNCKINEYLNEYMKLWPFSGVISVVKNGEIIFNQGYGMANVEHSIANTPKTKYKIASLTKQFTCAGIMILQEKGLLNVKDSMSKFFPEYPEFDERITVHHLMTHTSGLFNDLLELDSYPIIKKYILTHKETLDIFKDMPAEFEPGEDWSYCYFAYYLLGVIIERVSGMPYIEFLRENIFEPLGMKNTGLDDYFEILPNKVSGYYLSGDSLVHGEIDTVNAFSAGAMYSTAEDILIWDKALYGNIILSEKSKKEMFTPVKENYGYGWFIDEKFNKKRVHHSGGGNGFNHQLHRYIDDETTILVLSNNGFTNSSRINDDIARIVFGQEYSLPSKPKIYDLDFEVYDSYIGIYKDQWSKYQAKRDDKNLYIIEDDRWTMPIYPISKNVFHHTWIDCEYIFEKDDNGDIYLDGVKKVY